MKRPLRVIWNNKLKSHYPTGGESADIFAMQQSISHTQIAEFVSIRDSDHGIEIGDHIAEQALNSKKVPIGRDVWIARGVAILKGSIIEDGAVIGANSVVKGLISENMVAVGTPAKIIKKRPQKSNLTYDDA